MPQCETLLSLGHGFICLSATFSSSGPGLLVLPGASVLALTIQGICRVSLKPRSIFKYDGLLNNLSLQWEGREGGKNAAACFFEFWKCQCYYAAEAFTLEKTNTVGGWKQDQASKLIFLKERLWNMNPIPSRNAMSSEEKRLPFVFRLFTYCSKVETSKYLVLSTLICGVLPFS